MAASVIPAFSAIVHHLLTFVLAFALLALGPPWFALVSLVEAAEKQPRRDMVFSLVRVSNPACEPDCPEWIAADGYITDKTADAFQAILKKAGDRNFPLLIHSHGGRVDVAMAMGRLIRQRGMTVEVARTDYLLCEPWDETCKPDFDDGTFYGHPNTTFGICNSACPLVMAGGVRRIAGPFSRIGVHQPVTTRGKYRNRYKILTKTLSNGTVVTEKELVERQKIGTVTSTDLPASLRRDLESYLTGMGIKPALIDLMLSKPPEEVRYLNDGELKSLGMATEINEIEALFGSGICKGPSRPGYCVVRR